MTTTSRISLALLGTLSLLTCSVAAGVFADAVAPPSQELTCEFRDTYFLPRRLEEFGTRGGYVLVFTRLGDPASQGALDLLAQWEPRLTAAGMLPVEINTSPTDSLLDVALAGMQRKAAYPCGKDLHRSFQRQFGVTQPGTLVLLDKHFGVTFNGPAGEAAPALEALLNGATGTFPAPVSAEAPAPPAAGADNPDVTYARDLAPLIANNCMPCHAGDGVAPFALTSYQAVATRADMIAEVVAAGLMPPWYSHGGNVSFLNAPALRREDRAMFQRWLELGRPEGSAESAPATQPSPDDNFLADATILASDPITVPARGFADYVPIILPVDIREDLWLQGLRIVPGNRRVVHHAVLMVLPAGDHGKGTDPYVIALTAVGTQPMRYPDGAAAKVPKGARLLLNMHYEPTGKDEQDATSLELMFPRGPVRQQVRFISNSLPEFVIPANAPRTEFSSDYTLAFRPMSVLGLMVHTHLRAKSASISARYTNGTTSDLLVIPAWNFGWQLMYLVEPGSLVLPMGTVMRLTVAFDNSVLNPYNPDPNHEVKCDKGTTDEMMNGIVIGVNPNEHLNVTVTPEAQRAALQTTPMTPLKLPAARGMALTPEAPALP